MIDYEIMDDDDLYAAIGDFYSSQGYQDKGYANFLCGKYFLKDEVLLWVLATEEDGIAAVTVGDVSKDLDSLLAGKLPK